MWQQFQSPWSTNGSSTHLHIHAKEFKDIQDQHILNDFLDVCILLKPSPPMKGRGKNSASIDQQFPVQHCGTAFPKANWHQMIPLGWMVSFLWCKASCMKSCCQPSWSIFCQELELTRPVRGKAQSWAEWDNSPASGLSTTQIVHLLCNHLLLKASSLTAPFPKPPDKPVFYPGWEVGPTTAVLSVSTLMVITHCEHGKWLI